MSVILCVCLEMANKHTPLQRRCSPEPLRCLPVCEKDMVNHKIFIEQNHEKMASNPPAMNTHPDLTADLLLPADLSPPFLVLSE
jgi:hypothetical protein